MWLTLLSIHNIKVICDYSPIPIQVSIRIQVKKCVLSTYCVKGILLGVVRHAKKQ